MAPGEGSWVEDPSLVELPPVSPGLSDTGEQSSPLPL